MTVKELINQLKDCSPDAVVLLRSTQDLAQFELASVSFAPTGPKALSEMVMLWGDDTL